MELEKKIQADMVAAMKAKETVRLASLRAIKAAIMLAKTAEGATGEVDDSGIVKIIQKLVKQRKESAQQYNDAGRPELAENELAEAAAMEVYLPKHGKGHGRSNKASCRSCRRTSHLSSRKEASGVIQYDCTIHRSPDVARSAEA